MPKAEDAIGAYQVEHEGFKGKKAIEARAQSLKSRKIGKRKKHA
jgi:hypothetical protein